MVGVYDTRRSSQLPSLLHSRSIHTTDRPLPSSFSPNHHMARVRLDVGGDVNRHYFSSYSSDLRSHNTILPTAINRFPITSVKMRLCSSCSCSHDLTGASAQQSQVNATALRDLNVQYNDLVRFAGSEKIVQSTR